MPFWKPLIEEEVEDYWICDATEIEYDSDDSQINSSSYCIVECLNNKAESYEFEETKEAHSHEYKPIKGIIFLFEENWDLLMPKESMHYFIPAAIYSIDQSENEKGWNVDIDNSYQSFMR